MTIRTPPAWGYDRLKDAFGAVGSAAPDEYWGARRAGVPAVRRIGFDALGRALAAGAREFAANRSDVIFLCVIYPLAGLVFGAMAASGGLLHLLFPLASGFAIVGPFAAIGLYELSRRREAGRDVTWLDALGVIRSPGIGRMTLLGAMLMLILALWLVTAQAIYDLTLGPLPPDSIAGFARTLWATEAGHALVIAGTAAGAVFAAAAFLVSVVSFPVLLDRDVGLETAVTTSLRVVRANPGPMLGWAAIVTGGLVLGSLPLLVGLCVVLPVLGHATWHLYREVVAD